MINPYYVYVLSFFAVLLVYSFGWSTVYPSLSGETITLLAVTSIVCIYLGNKFRKTFKNRFDVSEENKLTNYGFIFIVVGYVLEFLYEGGIPLLNSDVNYMQFGGIPVFHVIIYTFTIFFATYLFYIYICNRDKKNIIMYFCTWIPSILLVSRGMLVNIIISSFFVAAQFCISRKIINKKIIVGIVSFSLVGLYLFGLMGNYRSNELNDSGYNKSDYILSVGEASDGFSESIIPKPFFWGYLYISSPLANFQKNVDNHSVDITLDNFRKFVTVEIIPDFISKRISKTYFEDAQKDVELIKRELVVGTFYMGPYYYLGFLGVALIFIYMISICSIYIYLLKDSKEFFVVGMAMLCNIIALNTFSNILSFSGMCFQLVFPVLFYIVNKYKHKLRFLNMN